MNEDGCLMAILGRFIVMVKWLTYPKNLPAVNQAKVLIWLAQDCGLSFFKDLMIKVCMKHKELISKTPPSGRVLWAD